MKGRGLMTATALLWGLAGVCVKSIPWNSMSIMAARCFISIILIAATRRSLKIHFNRQTLLGSVMMSLTGILYMMSIKLTTAATAIVLQYIAPILVFLFTVFFQKVKPRLYQVFIVFAVFAGIVLSFADELDSTHVAGNLLGLLSGFTFAGQLIVFADSRAHSEDGMLLANLMSFAVCLPFMFFDKNMGFSKEIIFWVLVLGIFQYGLANICYAKGCQLIDKVEGSLLLTIEPIFNPIPVFFVTGEKPGAKALAGFVVVIAAVALYAVIPSLEEKRRNRADV